MYQEFNRTWESDKFLKVFKKPKPEKFLVGLVKYRDEVMDSSTGPAGQRQNNSKVFRASAALAIPDHIRCNLSKKRQTRRLGDQICPVFPEINAIVGVTA